ncbi:chromosomal replication initiator protein DnaA [Thioclava dalianensis]|uniref:Chromosomal replication initiator protein DnaA n=1 Tax=Thioclava dalianensis TaxID=1185766 RepID=A0A074TGQ2_9RHOB|nr:DnaA/Hda family protein [Thioclava dalianensis]KEP70834.1 chromosomal replication initiator protein DnaA [Thioclava dalianensis]SFN12051.1 dnaA protein [Thioclava dalianensis]
MAKQLIFPLPIRSAQGREDFFIAPANALALSTLDAPQTWPNGRMILIGPEGAGKTHLAAIWAQEQGAEPLAARDLSDDDAPRLAAQRVAVIENTHQIGGDRVRETALFHLHNLMQAEGGRLLLTARTPPRDWGVTLPDLISRMEASATVRITPPDDALLAAVLVKLFNDRQLMVSPVLIDWLVTRMDRSLATARRLVAALDDRALSEQRAITRPLAAQVLDSLD